MLHILRHDISRASDSFAFADAREKASISNVSSNFIGIVNDTYRCHGENDTFAGRTIDLVDGLTIEQRDKMMSNESFSVRSFFFICLTSSLLFLSSCRCDFDACSDVYDSQPRSHLTDMFRYSVRLDSCCSHGFRFCFCKCIKTEKERKNDAQVCHLTKHSKWEFKSWKRAWREMMQKKYDATSRTRRKK